MGLVFFFAQAACLGRAVETGQTETPRDPPGRDETNSKSPRQADGAGSQGVRQEPGAPWRAGRGDFFFLGRGTLQTKKGPRTRACNYLSFFWEPKGKKGEEEHGGGFGLDSLVVVGGFGFGGFGW